MIAAHGRSEREAVDWLLESMAASLTRRWAIMEVCGGQTHAFVRHGLLDRLPTCIELLHGPGCPVCVTPISRIDDAIRLAGLPNVIVATFGDMLRVPGTQSDLQSARAAGADVRVVSTPSEAVDLAAREPTRHVVFFAVGFETTAPTTAIAVLMAREKQLANFSVLASHVRVPPAMCAILDAPDTRIDAFLAAGHVCTIMGTLEYEPIARNYGVPIVVTGFEPVDLLAGLARCVAMLERGESNVTSSYAGWAHAEGNPRARSIMREVFETKTLPWRGLGAIENGSLVLRRELDAFSADARFGLSAPNVGGDARACPSGDVLRGVLKPAACPHFGRDCTPERPLGAPMVSSEGACAAYFLNAERRGAS